jgi:hypothetical protein
MRANACAALGKCLYTTHAVNYCYMLLICLRLDITIQVHDPDSLMGPAHRHCDVCHYFKDRPAELFTACEEVHTHSTITTITIDIELYTISNHC